VTVGANRTPVHSGIEVIIDFTFSFTANPGSCIVARKIHTVYLQKLIFMRARFYDNWPTRIYFYEAVVHILLLHCFLIIAHLLASYKYVKNILFCTVTKHN